ncbi:MAG TPA: hypothetical protein VFW30_00405 [Bryocella sp.]|nr:hypothetical protein [Bryocella sp.]
MADTPEQGMTATSLPVEERKRRQGSEILGFLALHQTGFGRHAKRPRSARFSEYLTSKFQALLLEAIASPDVPHTDDEGFEPILPCPFCFPYCFPLDFDFSRPFPDTNHDAPLLNLSQRDNQ